MQYCSGQNHEGVNNSREERAARKNNIKILGGKLSFFLPSSLMGKTYLHKIWQIDSGEKDKKEEAS